MSKKGSSKKPEKWSRVFFGSWQRALAWLGVLVLAIVAIYLLRHPVVALLREAIGLAFIVVMLGVVYTIAIRGRKP